MAARLISQTGVGLQSLQIQIAVLMEKVTAKDEAEEAANLVRERQRAFDEKMRNEKEAELNEMLETAKEEAAEQQRQATHPTLIRRP